MKLRKIKNCCTKVKRKLKVYEKNISSECALKFNNEHFLEPLGQ